MNEIERYVQEKLFELQDEKYRDFHAALMPTVDKERVIGVRSPQLKKFAKDFYKSGDYENFLKIFPHKYYEENNVHAALIGFEKDYEKAIELLDEFLPFVDNWATCDMMRFPIFKRNLSKLYSKIPEWLESENPYTVRFGIKMLMDFFLGENFTAECAERVCSVHREEYYVKMMVAWYFATALAKNYDEVISYIENKRLEKWTHNKAIQKAIESYRIMDSQKKYLRALKIKEKERG